MERPDFSGWKLFGVLFVGFTILAILPVLLIARALMKSGGSVTNGLLSWHYLWTIARGQDDRGVPTRYLRLRSDDGADEVIIRAKGHYQGGSVMMDDHVTVEGNWRDGVLTARAVTNHRTRSVTRFNPPTSWH
jgi:hypothetical protein